MLFFDPDSSQQTLCCEKHWKDCNAKQKLKRLDLLSQKSQNSRVQAKPASGQNCLFATLLYVIWYVFSSEHFPLTGSSDITGLSMFTFLLTWKVLRDLNLDLTLNLNLDLNWIWIGTLKCFFKKMWPSFGYFSSVICM